MIHTPWVATSVVSSVAPTSSTAQLNAVLLSPSLPFGTILLSRPFEVWWFPASLCVMPHCPLSPFWAAPLSRASLVGAAFFSLLFGGAAFLPPFRWLINFTNSKTLVSRPTETLASRCPPLLLPSPLAQEKKKKKKKENQQKIRR